MRKPNSAVRPLAVWEPTDRIVYRALTNYILRNVDAVDQSNAAYLAMLNGPASYARDHSSRSSLGWIPDTSTVKYVVKTDITAFYQFIDHSLLARELSLVSDDLEAIDALIALLAEVQGRRYGLPQMISPSDRLADIYIQALHRRLVRQGRSVWRFNDDFRMVATSYADALAAIEDFAVAARRIGLVMSEHKTTTPSLFFYLMEDSSYMVDDGGTGEVSMEPGVTPDEFLGDYTETVSADEDPTDAMAIIGRVHVGPTTAAVKTIDLERLKSGDIRQLRRALNKLSRIGTVDALPSVALLMAYVPSLTPSIARYLIAASEVNATLAPSMLDVIVSQLSLNSWQQMWMLHVVRERLDLDAQPSPIQVQWVDSLRRAAHDPALVAHAAATAAYIGRATFDDLDDALLGAPAATWQWYLAAMTRATERRADKLAAVAGSEPLFGWILAQREPQ